MKNKPKRASIVTMDRFDDEISDYGAEDFTTCHGFDNSHLIVSHVCDDFQINLDAFTQEHPFEFQ